MESVREVLVRVDLEVATTTAAPDVREDLQVSECDLVSDDDSEGEGGEVESVPDETDYAGNLYDEFEMIFVAREQQTEADGGPVLNGPDSVVVDGEAASLWSKTTASPSNRPNNFITLPSPPSPSPNSLPSVPAPLIPPSEGPQKWPLEKRGGVPVHNELRSSVVSGTQCHPSVAPSEPSRVSGHFHIMGEVITEFDSPEQWMQGTMIQVFGEACCQATYSRPERARRVDILPSDLPAMLERLKRGIEGDRRALEMQIQRCLQPNHCGMWLIPICHRLHWWLIKIDWISETVLILESFSSRGKDAKEVLTLAREIVAKVHEVLERPYVLWNSFSLDQVSPKVIRVSPLLNDDTQRPPRQTNGHDCGPHLVYDIACLAESGNLGILQESAVPAWRKQIVERIRQLPIYDPKQPRLVISSDEIVDLTID
jgi:hypothetical protein